MFCAFSDESHQAEQKGLYYFAKRNETKRNEIGSDEIKQKE